MGRIIYLNEAPIGWNSKAMNSVTLSSTEAEYISMSEGLKDLKFIFMCLKYLKMKVNLPMLVIIDNIGAIEMLDLRRENSEPNMLTQGTTGFKNLLMMIL